MAGEAARMTLLVNEPGPRGYGKVYTHTDSSNMTPRPDVLPAGGGNTHDTVLEWTGVSQLKGLPTGSQRARL